jgi:hypothetical protein
MFRAACGVHFSQVNLPMLDHFCHPMTEEDMCAHRLGVGESGEPPIPDCAPHGYMTEHYNCSCWDDTIYKGATCKESCVQYCSGRGTCRSGNTTVCDCFDPVRWTGNRCEVSVCGEHGLVINGDYTAGTMRLQHEVACRARILAIASG